MVGQPTLQIVNLITGLLLLRWMSIEHYAQFGVAFAFQSTVCMLADVGLSSSILALAGARAKDPEVIGKYVRSARHFRMIVVCIVGVVFAILFPWITAAQPWSAVTKLSILASILCAVVVQGWAMYQAPLLGHRLIARVYQPQIAAGTLRLGLSVLLHATNTLTGVAASWLGTFALGISGWWIKRHAVALVKEPEKSDPAANKEMLRYLAPFILGVAFTAFQSQITIAIITIFGTSQSIAEVAALGRLGQIFGILQAFNGVIIAPYVASLAFPLFRRRYFQILVLTILVATLISALAFRFPGLLLWLLGPNYQGLGKCIGWTVCGSCICYVGGVMWTMHSAKKWVFWRANALYIVATILTQIVALQFVEINTTGGIVFFGLWTAIAGMASHTSAAVLGFRSMRKPELSTSQINKNIN